MPYYRSATHNLPTGLHNKAHGGDYEDHEVGASLADHVSRLRLGAEWTDDYEEAKRAARWGGSHTHEGQKVTPFVVHSDDHLGRNITGYSWKSHGDNEWKTHDLKRKTGVLQFFAQQIPGQTSLFPEPSKTKKPEPAYKKHHPNPADHHEVSGWNAPKGTHPDELQKWCPSCDKHHSEEDGHTAPECHEKHGCTEHEDDPHHSADEHYCENHEEEHESHWDAEDHNERDTSWHNHLPHIDEIHRGIGVRLPSEVHKAVHGHSHEEEGKNGTYGNSSDWRDKNSPGKSTAAHAIMKHFKNENLGMHWSANQGVSRGFAEANSPSYTHKNGVTEHGTHVIFHAHKPDHADIEKDGWKLAEHEVFTHASHEEEVPMKEGAKVKIHSVSWKHKNDDKWRHHKFEDDQHHTAMVLAILEG